jgi:hypothetical protein
MKKEFDIFDKFLVAFIAMMLIGVIGFVSTCVYFAVKEEKYVASLSEVELKEYKEQREKERQSRIHRYEVVGVTKYAEVSSRNMHRTKTTICYSFSYIQGDTLKHVDGFEHCEYGLYKVIIGDKDQYIIDTNGETTYYLQLTKETLSKIGG